MADNILFKLKIDEEFRLLIPPLSVDERKQLEENIVSDGCREPLSIWNDTILDGHNRYDICTRLQIPFSVVRISVNNREEAIAWICVNQLGRRNISEEARRYLIGKRYETEKILGAHNAAGTNQYVRKEDRPRMLVEPKFDEKAGGTARRIAEEYRVSHTAVQKFSMYTRAIDSLSKVIPDIIPKIMSGQLKISQENIIRLSRCSPQEIRRLYNSFSGESSDFIRYSCTKDVFPEKKKEPASTLIASSIKDMPIHDPDAEISSLVLTIPSWVSSIDRACSLSNLGEISNNARCKLMKELVTLRETIESMLSAIKEEQL